MRLGQPRSPVLVLLLTFLTCGLYYLWIIYIISAETRDALGETEINVSPGAEVLLTIVTFGIWDFYWDYRMGKRMALMCQRVGLPVTDNAVLYLVLDLVGVGFVNIVLEQDTLNRVWKAAQTGAWRPTPNTAWPPAPGIYPAPGPTQPAAPPQATGPASPVTPASSSETTNSEPQAWYSSSGKAPRTPRPPLKKK
jgi:hypothetical protein